MVFIRYTTFIMIPGIPSLDSKVFLEIKKKYRKVVNKRRIQLTLKEAYDYIEHGIRPEQDRQILHKIDFFLQRYPLVKGLYLAYDRIALILGNLITVIFDYQILRKPLKILSL